MFTVLSSNVKYQKVLKKYYSMSGIFIIVIYFLFERVKEGTGHN